MAILSTLKRVALRLRGGHFSPERPVLFALEVIAGLGVTLLLAFGVLLWRLSEGPVSLPFLHERLESTINAELSDAHAKFAQTVILKEKDGGIRLRLVDIKVRGSDGRLLAAAPMAAISMSPWGFFSGKTAVTRMVLIRPIITLTHGRDGQFSFGIAGSVKPASIENGSGAPAPKAPAKIPEADTPPERKALWSALFKEDQFNLLEKLNINPQSNLAHIGVKDASLIVIDEASGMLVKASKTRLTLNRTKTGYTLFASTRFNIKDAYSSLSFTASFEHGGRASVVTRFKDLTPAEFSPFLASPAMGGVDLPLSGKASFILDNSGVLLRASADIDAGAGLLKFGDAEGESILIDEAETTLHFDGETDSIAIEQGSVLSGYNRITYSGKVGLIRDNRRNVKAFDLALSSSDMALVFDEKSKTPVMIAWASLKAKITPAPFSIEIEKARMGAGKLQFDLAGSILAAPLSPEVRLQGSGKSIPVDVIKRLWPTTLAPGTREWIGNNIEAGYIKDARFNVHLLPGEIARARTGIPIPDDHVQLKFNAQNAKFTFMKGLPPIENATGYGLLEGDRLDIRLANGRIKTPAGGSVRLPKGRFTIPKIHEDVTLGKTNGYVTASLEGKTGNILEILDMKPLGFASMMKIRPQSVGGTTTGRLELSLPLVSDLTIDRVSVKVKASLKDTKIPQIYKGVDLKNGDMIITVDNNSLESKGKIALNGVPFTLKWNERFRGNKKLTTRFELGGTLGGKARKALGIDLTPVMRGPASIKLVAHARRGQIAWAHIKADLKRSKLRQSDIKWKKPAGVPATAAFNLDFTDKKLIRLRKLDLKGKNLSIKGAIRFDDKGRILKLDLGQVQLGRSTRFSLSGRRGKSGTLHLKARGKRFDARALLKDLMTAAPPASPPGTPGAGGGDATDMTLDAAFGEILMLNNVRLYKGFVKLHSARDLMESFSLKGVFDSRRPVRVDISRINKATRQLRISSTDGGALLRGVDFYTHVKGGKFDLFSQMKNPGGGMSGKVRIEKFSIAGEPALKSILSSPDLKTKRRKAENAENVPFDKLKLTFERIPGVFTIKSALIAGPSIGATARGRINQVNHSLKIAGTLVPFYGLNAALGKIPLLGRLLSGRKGEGLFGITYGIQGPIKRPVITINPASALAPGFLRMLFEFNSGIKSTPIPTQKSPGDR